MQDRLKNVQEVQASQHAFAALLSDGSVVSWGLTAFGGSSKPVDKLLKDVRQVQATRYAFAALLANGSVVTWGNEEYGGDSSHVEHRLKDVLQIQANHFAFAAILADGSVVTWGERNNGGDSRAVKDSHLVCATCISLLHLVHIDTPSSAFHHPSAKSVVVALLSPKKTALIGCVCDRTSCLQTPQMGPD